MSGWEPVIGMEVHAQVKSRSKLFTGAPTSFGQAPNTQVTEYCLALPGVLPVLNQAALGAGIRMALALNCTINPFMRFARKNYFYPDLPKAYQISMYEEPVGVNGWVDVPVEGGLHRVRIHRLHLEEDAGKLLHAAAGSHSHVDLNRAGTALMEIVTEPDIHSAEQAVAYLKELRNILLYLDVCDGNMEEGSLRCEPNISVRPVGESKLGVKSELKNINSFRAVKRGIEFEVARQVELLESGGKVVQETRRFDDGTGKTIHMRFKEHAHDYRYFPDPDLPPVVVNEAQIEEYRQTLPELPVARRERFVSQFGLSAYDAEVLCASRSQADFFEQVAAAVNDAKETVNWIAGVLAAHLNENNLSFEAAAPSAAHLQEVIALVREKKINRNTGREVYAESLKTGKAPGDIVKEKGLGQVADEGQLKAFVQQVIEENPGPATDFRGGKEKAMGFLVGQVMKKSKGQADPALVNQLMKEALTG